MKGRHVVLVAGVTVVLIGTYELLRRGLTYTADDVAAGWTDPIQAVLDAHELLMDGTARGLAAAGASGTVPDDYQQPPAVIHDWGGSGSTET